MNLTEELKRGEDAKQLLDHYLFKQAFSDVKEGIVKSMGSSPMGDEKTHNRLVIALQLLNQIEKSLVTHIETGKMAVIQLDNSLADKVRRMVA